MAGKPEADGLVDRVFDPKQHDAVAKAIQELSPDEAQYFLDKLERALRKRKIQLLGYLVAMVVWLAGMVFALGFYGMAAEGTFMGWVFIIPFTLVAVILIFFGKWADRVGKSSLPK